ncbi:hypothetical protein SAMN05216327_11358 [Dyadobacter sp. SG02]|uniref:hypothetical protein n=1 Tax=Dyadobacter sp. SG02 TaxID=1855291 RepID=UPI0008C108E5|nr:hypothetical protein [Dyadobacter sp. SG02]SEJ58224.1 hypothetical protein SAMN05216327_11358 [Dyadobacter sp. SG02]
MITITETGPGHADFPLFTELPKRIYPPDSLRFKTPDTIPTDFLRACYLLKDGENVVARASIYDNPLLQYAGRHAFSIGNYECADGGEYAATLLGHIASVVKSWGGGWLIGPMNGNTWEGYRFLADHHNPLFFTEHYHHLYYNTQFKTAGFGPIAQYYSNIDHGLEPDNPEILARERAFERMGVKIRPIDLTNFEAEIGRVYDFNLLAFKTNFLYTPISREAFMKKYLQTKTYINPGLTLLAEDSAGNLLGYFFCIHDFYNTESKSLIVKTLARHPGPEWRGLGHVIGNVIYRNAVELGYTSAIHSFIYEQGTSTQLSTHFSGTHYRNYILYGKHIA